MRKSTRPKNMRAATAPMRSPSSWRGCSSSRRDINPHGEEYWAYIARMTEPLALYVHWPFCVSKCPYCDFNSHVRERVDQAAWRDALLNDLRHEAVLVPGSSDERRVGKESVSTCRSRW